MVVLLPWAIASVVAGVFWRFIFDTHFGIVNGILHRAGVHRPAGELAPEHRPGDLDRDRRAGLAIRAAARGAAARRAPHDPPAPVSRRPDGWRDLLGLLPPHHAARHPPDAHRRRRPADHHRASRCSTCCTRLTSGGPGRATYVLIYAIYEMAFADVSLGYASAITVVLFFIIVACSMLLLLFQVRRRRRPEVIDDEETELAAATADARSDSSVRVDEARGGAPCRRCGRSRCTGRSSACRAVVSQGGVRGPRRRAAVLLRRPHRVDGHREPADGRGPVAHAAAACRSACGRTATCACSRRRNWQGSLRGQPHERDRHDVLRDPVRVTGRLLAGPVPAARQAGHPRRS